MLKRISFNTASFIFSLIAYNYFFWKENLGLNLFLFALIIIISLFIGKRDAFKSKNVQITLVGTVLTAIMVVAQNSALAKTAHVISILLFATFIHESQMRSVVFALLHMLSGLFRIPKRYVEHIDVRIRNIPRLFLFFRIARISIIPLSIAFVFYILYSLANPIFVDYSANLWHSLIDVFEFIFRQISPGRILFVLLGALVLSVIYFRNEAQLFLRKDLSFAEKLERIRKPKEKRDVLWSSITRQPIYPPSEAPFKSIALKNQNRRGIVLLLFVNFLLLLENLIDIKWLWFGFKLPEGFSLQHYVREGTGFLIISILLSMGLLLFYFRRNLNFYSKNNFLKILAYAWIGQNVILCISIFLRNYHYIDFHGLAYKRIGVDVFLLLTVIGLLTLYNKIRNVKSAYYLVRLNTWALYFIIVIISCINWDEKIASYNLAHWNKSEIDVDFYLKLSDKTLPIVYQNLDKVREQIEAHSRNKVKWIQHLNYQAFLEDLDSKRENFFSDYQKHSWLSFTIPDRRAYQALHGELYTLR